MAKKPPASAAKTAAKKSPAKKAAARKAAAPKVGKDAPFPMFDPQKLAGMDLSKMKMMTPEQAMDLYKANARMALDIINAAIENTGKLRRLQFEGEEESRAMGRKTAKAAAEAGTPDEMMALGQSASQEAVEHAMRYWGQMFDLISEMQKRLWVMIEEQMQGVVTSGGNAFESMQKVMGDFARYMPGMKR